MIFHPVVITSEIDEQGKFYYEAQYESWFGFGPTPDKALEDLHDAIVHVPEKKNEAY